VETGVLQALIAHRHRIRANWETFLRLERPSSPLANPDALVHLLDRTLDEIFTDLALWSARAHPRAYEPRCPCGRNPWLTYLDAGRQALREALVEVQAALPDLLAPSRDESMACLDQVLDHLARREIEAFCALCQFRSKAEAHPPSLRQVSHHAHHAHHEGT
jgi:hypothetical protein